ncbi:uncharacterized protein [Atheta coriaria]|uniref:uncharacterized protein n=1 Tax=Dalotia coriaria TaxID=877792 RepID=UPI0031F34E67
MATYVQHKSTAFRKIDDVRQPQTKRSESRLKRYSSVTDSRVWMNNALENKAFIFNFMGQEYEPTTLKKRKIMGQIIPIDMIWKILMSNKNNYIYDLEERIDNFVDLFHKINLSKNQIAKIRRLCATTYRSINNYLMKYKLTERRSDDFEKSIQASPRTINTITETVTETINVGMKTISTEVHDSSTHTKIRAYCDKSSGTAPRAVSDVCLQVVLAPRLMADKCVSVKVRSSIHLQKNKSINEKHTEISTGRFKMPSIPLRRSSARDVVNKSQSAIVCTQNASVDVMHSRSRRSCVSFAKKSEMIPICLKIQPPDEGVRVQSAKAFGPDDSINPLEIIDDIIGCAYSPSSSGETIEVVSECEQTSFSERNEIRPSVIQLYRSYKSSLESTLNHSKHVDGYETDHSNEDVAISNPNFIEKHLSDPGLAPEKSDCDECCKQVDTESLCDKCIDCQDEIGETDDDNEQFEDCRPPTRDGKKKKDQETHIISCIRRKHANNKPESSNEFQNTKSSEDYKRGMKDEETNVTSCIKKYRKGVSSNSDYCASLKIAEAELAKHKILAENAICQLELVRQTLLTNNVTISEIDTMKIAEAIQSNSSSKDLNIFHGCLTEACGYEVEPTIILHEQLQLIEQVCMAIIDTKYLARYKLLSSESVMQSSHANIVDIVGSETKGYNKLKQQIEFYKTQVLKMEQISLERNQLQQNVYKLEGDLRAYSGIRNVLVSDPDIAEFLQADDVIKEVCDLKRKADLCEQYEQDLACEKCCVATLKENLSHMSANRFNEYESLRYKAQEADILRLELDRLRIQFSDIHKLQADNINLYNKCAELQRASQMNLKNHPATVSQAVGTCKEQTFDDQSEEIEKLKQEKQALLCAVVVKECELVDQEDEIDRLVKHVDRLTTNNEIQQEKSKQIVSQLRSDLNTKSSYITKLDNNLEWMEDKLKASITSISKDSNKWQSKLCNLERSRMQYKAKNDALEDTINELRKQLQMQEELNQTYSIELQKKAKQLEELKEKDPNGINQRIKSATKMECILKKSHNAVRKVVEELAKQYRCDLKEIQEVVPELKDN